MSIARREFSTAFHKFLVYGALWFFGIGMILTGCVNSGLAIEDGLRPRALILAMQAVLILAGGLVIKGRFDLAKLRKAAPAELLAGFLAAAVVFFFDWRIHEVQGELVEKEFLFPLLSACWGVSIWRYYRQYDGLLK